MTGAGKSTLLGLIPRFYDPHAGRILADGKDLRDLDLDAFRRQIGIVYQESFLFSNTVAANIAFGHPHATMEQIERAARIASAHEFITGAAARLRDGAGRIGRGFVGRPTPAAGAGAGVDVAAADPDSRRPDGVGGCADGK
jgi:ABC-type bacteriocin/lantibiotic exporter with double-glycine peptidase domain